jgi:hypothetical protein
MANYFYWRRGVIYRAQTCHKIKPGRNQLHPYEYHA